MLDPRYNPPYRLPKNPRDWIDPRRIEMQRNHQRLLEQTKNTINDPRSWEDPRLKEMRLNHQRTVEQNKNNPNDPMNWQNPRVVAKMQQNSQQTLQNLYKKSRQQASPNVKPQPKKRNGPDPATLSQEALANYVNLLENQFANACGGSPQNCCCPPSIGGTPSTPSVFPISNSSSSWNPTVGTPSASNSSYSSIPSLISTGDPNTSYLSIPSLIPIEEDL